MPRSAIIAALLALSMLGSVGSTFAQDDGGGSTDSGAATTPDTPSVDAASPDAGQTAAAPAVDSAAPADDSAAAADANAASDPAALSAAQSQLTWSNEYSQAQMEKAEGLKDLVAAVGAMNGDKATTADVAAVSAAEAKIKAANDAMVALNANRPKP